jgi:hypothetical protein
MPASSRSVAPIVIERHRSAKRDRDVRRRTLWWHGDNFPRKVRISPRFVATECYIADESGFFRHDRE